MVGRLFNANVDQDLYRLMAFICHKELLMKVSAFGVEDLNSDIYFRH